MIVSDINYCVQLGNMKTYHNDKSFEAFSDQRNPDFYLFSTNEHS
jgi:hypothetical protein